MDFHIDRRVVLYQDSKFKNLYKWSLQELDSKGNEIGPDQIPWAWSLYFTATELTFSDEVEIKEKKSGDNGKRAIREEQSILAKLHPGDPREHCRDPNTSYSMFGTNREISNFTLQIIPLEGEDQQEECAAWGCVSYTSEIDFRNETTDDTVCFFLYVRPETFTRFARKIAASEVDKAFLRVGHVAGFYSDFSPSISADEIRVLTDHREHVVEVPDECEIVPPRLGEVGAAALTLHRINNLETAKAETGGEDDDWFDDQEPPPGRKEGKAGGPAVPQLAGANTRLVSLMSSLRMAAWVIAALLLLILIK